MDRIAIIGLGFIGASIGYTLRLSHSKRYEVVGFDYESKIQQKADKTGALDESVGSLVDVARDADIVVIATPFAAARQVFEDIAPHLKHGAVVTDTTTAAVEITRQAEEVLPRGVGFVSGHPLVYGASIEDATGAAFKDARWALAPTPTAPQTAVRQLIRMVEDLGARPFFISMEEHDSYIAAVVNLPIVVSNAIMLAAARSPSWREISRFATDQFGEVSSASRINAETNASAIASNAEMTIHWIDQMILELVDFRAMLDHESRNDPDGPLAETLNSAWEARLRWENKIDPTEVPRPDLPTSGEMMLGVLVGQRVAERISGSRHSEYEDY